MSELKYENVSYEYGLRCDNCRLHYTVWSWVGDWHAERGGGFCPQCGIKGGKVVWGPTPHVGLEIFERVPNPEAVPTITAAEQVSPFGIGGGMSVGGE